MISSSSEQYGCNSMISTNLFRFTIACVLLRTDSLITTNSRTRNARKPSSFRAVAMSLMKTAPLFVYVSRNGRNTVGKCALHSADNAWNECCFSYSCGNWFCLVMLCTSEVFLPKYRLGHPENYSFLLSLKMYL